jgi:hypothetical protein
MGIVRSEEFATHNPFPPLLDLIKERPSTVAKEWLWLLLFLLDKLIVASPPARITFNSQGLFAVPDAIETLKTCCEVQPNSRDPSSLCLSLLLSDTPDLQTHVTILREALAVKTYPAPFEKDGHIRFRIAGLLAQDPGLHVTVSSHSLLYPPLS